jgi:hypothetical protein
VGRQLPDALSASRARPRVLVPLENRGVIARARSFCSYRFQKVFAPWRTAFRSANSRGVRGVSDTLVHHTLKQGWLAKRADGTTALAPVGTCWRTGDGAKERAKEPLQSGSSAKGLAYADALRLKENRTALLRRLEFEQKSGALVEIAVARGIVFGRRREQRDAWPAKVASGRANEASDRRLSLLSR